MSIILFFGLYVKREAANGFPQLLAVSDAENKSAKKEKSAAAFF